MSYKIIIGFITYGENTAKYLPYFLGSLVKQTYQNSKIIAIDNSETGGNSNRSFMSANYPEISLDWAGENLGFAKAYNRLIKKAASDGAEYFLMLNPDIILQTDAIERLVEEISADPKLGSVSPKILSWDFAHRQQTDIIDTAGIALRPGLRFVDYAQGQKDIGQCRRAPIIGPSGAAGLFRMSALESAAEDGCYFDERMFMYKEDCDLAYRLHLKNWQSRCVDRAVVYHDRTAKSAGESSLSTALNRCRKSRQVKIWSFANQQLIFKKHWRTLDASGIIALLAYQAKIFGFIIMLEQYLLKEFGKVWFRRI